MNMVGVAPKGFWGGGFSYSFETLAAWRGCGWGRRVGEFDSLDAAKYEVL